MDTYQKDKSLDWNVLNMRVCDLKNSPHPEDNEMAKTCEQILEIVVKKIKPILRYICKLEKFSRPEGCVRCLKVGYFQHSFDGGSDWILFLNLNGKFFTARPTFGCPEIKYPWGRKNAPDLQELTEKGENESWLHVQFFELFHKIKEAIDLAEQNRKKHLEVLMKRKRLLDDIMKIIET